jgi:hypothetical protein
MIKSVKTTSLKFKTDQFINMIQNGRFTQPYPLVYTNLQILKHFPFSLLAPAVQPYWAWISPDQPSQQPFDSQPAAIPQISNIHEIS